MKTATAELLAILSSPEGARVEFKEARNRYDFDELVKYCAALANEGGGKIVLGASDKRPRRIVGTNAFAEPGRTEAGVFEQLHHRVTIEEVRHDGHRLLIVHVPSRLPGTAWQHKGAYWMRSGDALVPMNDETLRQIHEESGPDFSAEICPEAKLSDLEPAAVALLRELWQRRSPRQDIATRSVEQLLADAELYVGGLLTYAAVIMLGTYEALGRLLGQAEVVFEYRSGEAPGPASERREYRQGFLPILDPLWGAINLRNDLQHFQQGLFVWDVPTFHERAVREAVLNAVSHRDYRSTGSVFVRQYPRRIEIVSPGRLPPGIDQTNLLWEQNPRNRRIAEVLGKCGLVERAGQGIDLMYRECIRHSKPLPDFSHTGEHSVWVTLHGEIQDPEFLRFLEEIGRERAASFSTEDFLVIDLVHREVTVPEHLAPRVQKLLEEGIIERVGRGRGTRYLLSRRFYRFLGKGGVYTRRRGLDRGTNKALLLRHIEDSDPSGSRLKELQQVLPALSRHQVQTLLRELKRDGRIIVRGMTKAARWFPVAPRRNPTQ